MSREDSKRSYRYNITALSKKTGEEARYGIEISDNIPYITDRKSLLAEIDLFTMRSKDVNDLDFEFMRAGELDEDATFYIVYKSTIRRKDNTDGDITESYDKKAAILYKEDSEEMLPFAEELSSTVNTNSDHFCSFFNNVLSKGKNWMDFMRQHRYISKNLYEKLKEHLVDTSDKLIQNQIVDMLSSYKVIRNIHLGNKAIEKKRNKKKVLSDGQVDMTPSNIFEKLNEAYEILMERSDEDEMYQDHSYEEIEAYKDYADEDWHR